MPYLHLYLLLLITGSCLAKNSPLVSFCAKHKALNDSAFFNTFPFTSYFDTVMLDRYGVLETHRQVLLNNNRNGDDFIKTLGEAYLKYKPINLDNFKQTQYQIELGGMYTQTLKKIIPKRSIVYAMLGGTILQGVSDSLKVTLIKKQHNESIQYYTKRLAYFKYIVGVPTPNLTKLFNHIKTGNWHYLYYKLTGPYKQELLMATTPFCLIMISLFFFVQKKITQPKNKNKQPI
jgi:hypothetical protein